MREKEIVVFRYRKGLRVGFFLGTSSGKAKVATVKDRAFTVPVENILLATGEIANTQAELNRYAALVTERAATLDLEELWELVSGEWGESSFASLAELYEAPDTSSTSRAALLWHLESDDCVHFDVKDGQYAVRTPEEVAAAKERRERQLEAAREEEAFEAWLTEGTEPEWTSRQASWRERLVAFTAEADECVHATWAKTLLKRVGVSGDARRSAFDLLVRRRVLDRDEDLELRRVEVPIEFSADVLATASEVIARPESGPLERRDLTALEVFTVDSAETTDIDDAISLERESDGYRIGIHVTDLSALVKKGDPLDRVARERLLSLYFPDRRVPMLPPEISAGAGSLLEGEVRPALSLLVRVGPEGERRSSELVPSRIASRSRLTYDEVDAALEGRDVPLAESIRTLARLLGAFRRARQDAGAVHIDRPELDIVVDESGGVDIRTRPTATAANHLVSEAMVLYNAAVAEHSRTHGLPSIYRHQEVGDLPPVTAVASAHERYTLFRHIRPSQFGTTPLRHALLGVEAYSQVSSPIRRYIDLVVQRQVMHAFRFGGALYSESELARLLVEVQARAKELSRLEPQRIRYWLTKYFANRRGDRFAACVLEVRERDAIVELVEFGFRAPALLSGSPAEGEEVEVEVAHTDVWDATIRFRSPKG